MEEVYFEGVWTVFFKLRHKGHYKNFRSKEAFLRAIVNETYPIFIVFSDNIHSFRFFFDFGSKTSSERL